MARLTVVGALALAGVSGGLWVATEVFGHIGIFSLGSDVDLRFGDGEARVRRFYDHNFEPPVPKDQWHGTAIARGWVDPPRMSSAWRGKAGIVPRFGFSSGHVGGMGGVDDSVSPARYWLLNVPLWATMLPGVVVAAWLVIRHQRHREARRRGFGVISSASPTTAPQA